MIQESLHSLVQFNRPCWNGLQTIRARSVRISLLSYVGAVCHQNQSDRHLLLCGLDCTTVSARFGIEKASNERSSLELGQTDARIYVYHIVCDLPYPQEEMPHMWSIEHAHAEVEMLLQVSYPGPVHNATKMRHAYVSALHAASRGTR